MATSNNNLAPSKNARQSPQKTYLTFAQAAISKAATIVKQTISHLFLSLFRFALALSLSLKVHTLTSHTMVKPSVISQSAHHLLAFADDYVATSGNKTSNKPRINNKQLIVEYDTSRGTLSCPAR